MTMKNTTLKTGFRISSLLSALGLIVGCQAKTVPVNEHEGPLQPKIVHAPRTVEASSDTLARVDLGKMHELVTKENDPQALLKTLNELSKFVMNGNYVENPEYNKSNELRTLLTYFNFGLKKLQQTSPDLFKEGGEGRKLFDTYRLVAFSNCDADLKGCKNTSFFHTDANSAAILQLIAKQVDQRIESAKVKKNGVSFCETDCLVATQDYYRLLQMASDIAPKGKDLEREFLYLKRAGEYALFFQALGESQRNSASMQRHAKVFEDIIANYPANPKDPAFEKFVLDFSPWTFSHLEPNPFPYGTKRMFNYAASNYLYADAGKTRLTPGLSEALEKSQLVADKSGPSFSQMVAKLKEANDSLFKNLLEQKDLERIARKDFIMSEYFFMVDRLYRGHLEIDEVAQIWAGSTKNQEKLLGTVETYMKLQVLNMLEETNIYMRGVYAGGDFSGETLVKQVVERSKEISDRWMKMHERFDYIAILLGRELKGKTLSPEQLEQTTTMVDSIRRNIKYLSVYPNMMLLSYFVSKAKGNLTFTTWYGAKFDVAPATIVATILNGRLAPWFRFGNNDEPIDHIEMLYAYYFSLATGTFETFAKVEKDLAGKEDKKHLADLPTVDRKVFLPEVIKLYLTNEQEELETGVRFIKQQLPSSSRLSAIERICAFEKSGSQDYQVFIDLENFERFAFTGSSSSGPVGDLQEFYTNSSGPAVHVRKIREDIDKKLIFVNTLMELLFQNMKSQGASDTEIEGLKTYLNNEIGKITKLKTDYYDAAFAFHRKFSDCFNTLNNREREREKALLTAERAHLGAVYEIISALQGVDDAQVDAAIPSIVAKLQQEGKIPATYTEWKFTDGLDRISKSGYRYTKTELFLRMKDRSEKLRPAVKVNPITGDITRLESYSKTTVLPIQTADGSIMPKEDFVRSGMRMLNGFSNAFLKWPDNASLAPLLNKTAAMVQLYKLGMDLGLPADKRVTADEVLGSSLDILRWVHIDAQEAALLRDLGLNSRTPKRTEWDRVLFDMNANEKKLSIFENVYDQVRANDERLEIAKKFATTVTTMGHFLFAPEKAAKDMMRSQYLPLVAGTEAIVADFEEAVKRAEKKDKAAFASNPEQFQIRYELGETVPSFYAPEFRTDADGSRTPIYLDPVKTVNQANAMKRFHEELTDRFFTVDYEKKASGALK